MAYIRKRKGSYQVVIRKVGHQTLTKSFKQHVDAMKFAKAIEGKLIEKDYDLEFLNRKEYPSFRKCLERYKEEVSSAKRSYDMEEKLIKYILREGFSNLRIDRIDQKVMAAYRDRSLQTLGAASVNRRLAIISHMFSICKKEWGYDVSNPVRNIRKPRNPEPRDRDFSQQELHNLLRGNQARTIRIPVHMIETINKIVRTQRQIMSEFGREPTPEELAKKLAMPLEKVRKVLKIAKEPVSLETPVGDEEDSSLGDFIEDKNALQPLDTAIQSNLSESTTKILASLTPREERVLRMRFGIGMNTDHTLEEVGLQFSVTRERIRQIEAKALRKLKHPSRSKQLKSFLEK